MWVEPHTRADLTDYHYSATRLDSTGSPIDQPFSVSQPDYTTFFMSVSGGAQGWLAAWQLQDNLGYARFVDAQGEPGAIKQFSAGRGLGAGMQVAHAEEGWLCAWQALDDRVPSATLFGPDGQVLKTIVLDTTTAPLNARIDVEGSPTGYRVSWFDGSSNLRTRRLTSTGDLLGSAPTILPASSLGGAPSWFSSAELGSDIALLVGNSLTDWLYTTSNTLPLVQHLGPVVSSNLRQVAGVGLAALVTRAESEDRKHLIALSVASATSPLSPVASTRGALNVHLSEPSANQVLLTTTLAKRERGAMVARAAASMVTVDPLGTPNSGGGAGEGGAGEGGPRGGGPDGCGGSTLAGQGGESSDPAGQGGAPPEGGGAAQPHGGAAPHEPAPGGDHGCCYGGSGNDHSTWSWLVAVLLWASRHRRPLAKQLST